jgi:hypothetical protein
MVGEIDRCATGYLGHRCVAVRLFPITSVLDDRDTGYCIAPDVALAIKHFD